MQKSNTVAIIGAGAAGCFCAIELKRRYPSYRVIVFEAAPKPMMKLALTGGGRCNLTNSFEAVEKLEEVYPRGDKLLKKLFYNFDHESTMRWFEAEGIKLTTQSDHCVFPVSQDAMQIVRKLETLMRQNGVEIKCNSRIQEIVPQALNEPQTQETPKKFRYKLTQATGETFTADYIVLTAGGTKQTQLQNLLPKDIEITQTVPSLFTFKIPVPELKALMGTVVQKVELALTGTKFHSSGTLLITDWGISGPASLCLSSYAATHLASTQYTSELRINWLASNEENTREQIDSIKKSAGNKLVTSLKPQCFSDRLWKYLLLRSEIKEQTRWSELGSKTINRLVNVLTSDIYPIKGRAAFKEEFVTCGGVALSEINPKSLESKKYPRLFFAGEVLDIDAITGGFNLQAAWTTAFVAAKLGQL